jgi:nucleoid-associated protein YgaU
VQDNRLPDDFVAVQDAAVAVEHARPVDARPRQIIHYVKEGETLATIARQYYGDPLEYQRIVDANKKAIPNPNLIRPGVRLMIPPKGAEAPIAAAPAERPATPTPAADKSKFTTYKLAEGDTLSDVAARFFGSSKQWQKVYELNKDRIDNPDRVAAGTELRVPAR